MSNTHGANPSAENLIKVRLSLLYKTESEWTAWDTDENQGILKSGEIGINSDTNQFKIGNGETRWSELDYFASSNHEDRIAEIERFFNTDDLDGDSELNRLVELQKWIVEYEDKIKEEIKRSADQDKALSQDISDLERDLIGDENDAIRALTMHGLLKTIDNETEALESSLNEQIEKINILIGTDAGKSVRAIASEELAAQLIGEDAKDSLDSLTEIAAWIQDHPDDAAAMNQDISNNSAAIVKLEEKIDNLNLDDASIKLTGPYTFTKDFGYYTLDGASYKKYGAKDQTLKDFLQNAFAQEDPELIKSLPSYSIAINGSASGEIGATVTPTYSITKTAGEYLYGIWDSEKEEANFENKATGITYGEDIVSATQGTLNATITYTSEAQTYSLKAENTRSAAQNKPVSNIGSEKAIPTDLASSINVSNTAQKTFTGYREGCFYGSVNNVSSVNDITHWIIRNLDKKLGAKYSTKNNLSHSVAVGDTAIIIACPATNTGVTSVLNTTVNAEMKDNFKTITISVGGADSSSTNVGEYAIDYKVWYYIPVEAYGSKADLQIDLG